MEKFMTGLQILYKGLAVGAGIVMSMIALWNPFAFWGVCIVIILIILGGF